MSRKCDICQAEGNRSTIMQVTFTASTALPGASMPDPASRSFLDCDMCEECVDAATKGGAAVQFVYAVARARGIDGFRVTRADGDAGEGRPAPQSKCPICAAGLGEPHDTSCPQTEISEIWNIQQGDR